MTRKLIKPILTISILTFTRMLFAQETCNAIDVMTSPTKKFSTLTGSQYCATSAKIVWKDGETAGTRRIDYGTSTSYGQSITLTGSSGTSIMSGLNPKTVYYWRVYRYYQGNTVTTPVGYFTTTTVKQTAVNGNVTKFNNKFSLMIGKNSISLPFNNENTLMLSIISLDGSVVMKKAVSLNGSDIRLNFSKTGTYICKAEFKSGAVYKKIVIQ